MQPTDPTGNGSNLEKLLRKYHALWEMGQPDVRRLVAYAGGLQLPDLVALLRIDQRCRLERSLPATAEGYLEAFPTLRNDTELLIELVYGEFLTRVELGQKPTASEYARRFPDLAERLRQQIDLHGLLTVSAADKVQADLTLPLKPAPAEETALPRVVGFELLDELGRGGMGVVYKARHLGLKRLVALKMILSTAWADRQERKRFRAEAEAVARLRHANIVQVFDIGGTEDRPYLVLEYLEGGTLAAKWRGEPQPPRQAAALVQMLARAVEHAHQAGVIHRDLKPANVLLAADGTPKVVDFGLAKRLDSATLRTQTGAVMGTPAYMAPEQAGGATHAIGPPCDIYALGAILYEGLTGRPPFKADTPWNTFHLILHTDPVPVRRLNPNVPRDLETICLKCLEKAAPKRYASAQALADDLGQLLAGQAVHARPTRPWERAARWAKRRPAIAALASVLAAVVVLAFVLITRQWLRADSEAGARAREAERARLAEVDALEKARRETEARQVAQRGEAEMALDRGIDLCKRGEVGQGLHLFVRCLELAPSDAADLRRAARYNFAAWEPLAHKLDLLLDHGGPITGAALSPDGTRIATAGWDGAVALWSARDGSPIERLAHGGPVNALTFSGDGKRLVTGVGQLQGKGGEAVVWDVSGSNAKRVGPAMQHPGAVLSVAASRDGAAVLTGCQDHCVRLWKNGAPTWENLSRGPVFSVALSPDGTRAAFGARAPTEGEGEVQVWDTMAKKQRKAVPTGHVPRGALACAEDSPTVLTCVNRSWKDVNEAEVVSVDIAGAGPATTLVSHSVVLTALAFGPTPTTFVTAGRDSMVRLWARTEKGATPLGTPIQHHSPIRSLACSRKNDRVMVGCADGSVWLWRFSPGATTAPAGNVPRVELPPYFSPAAAYSPDGKQFVAAYGQRNVAAKGWGWAGLWDAEKRIRTPRHYDIRRALVALAVSPDGSKAAFAPEAMASVSVWGLNAEPPRSHELDQRIFALAWGRDQDGNERVAAGCANGIVVLLDPRPDPWKRLGALPEVNVGPVRDLAFRPDGRLLAIAEADGKVRFWDPYTLQTVPTPEPMEHPGPALCLAFHPNGRMLVSGGADGTACRWEVPTGKAVGMPMMHPAPVKAVALSENGELLATATTGRPEDSAVHFWDSGLGKPVGDPYRLGGPVRSLAFRPHGAELLIAAGGPHPGEPEDRARSKPRFEFLPLPALPADDSAALRKRVEVLTGQERTPAGINRPLNAAQWQERRELLNRKSP